MGSHLIVLLKPPKLWLLLIMDMQMYITCSCTETVFIAQHLTVFIHVQLLHNVMSQCKQCCGMLLRMLARQQGHDLALCYLEPPSTLDLPSSHDVSLPNLFEGVVAYLCDVCVEDKKKWTRYIVAYNGDVCSSIHDSTTHIITGSGQVRRRM